MKTSSRVIHQDDVTNEVPAHSVCELYDSKTPQPTARIVEHRCGMQGVRVGEASNPGPPRRLILRPVEGREVVQRINPSQTDATVRDTDCEIIDEVLDGVQEGPRARDARRSRRRARSDSESEGPLVHRNRFSVLNSDSDDAPLARLGIQSPEGGTTVPASSPPAVTVTEEPVHREFDMTLQDSDTESVGTTQLVDHCRNSNQGNRRLQLQWSERVSQTIHREIRAAAGIVDNLGRRIGSVLLEGRIPRLVRQQRWSPFNVPLFWDAASLAPSSPVLEWIMASASRISRPIEFHEGQVAPQEAARIGWLALREVMRSWGIVSREGLTQWLQSEGFQAVQPGNHIGARAQEVLLGRACSEDARVALLESVYVALVLHTGREIRVEPALAGNRSTTTGQCPGRMGTIGRSRFARRVAQPGGDVEELPSFPPGQDERSVSLSL